LFLVVATLGWFAACLLLVALQGLGVPWAYRIGFPLGTFRAADGATLLRDGTTAYVRLHRRKQAVLIKEQYYTVNPMQRWSTAGWPDKVIGWYNPDAQPAILRIRTDAYSSSMWLLFGMIVALLIWALATWQPGVRGADGVTFSVGFASLLLAGLVYFPRRARRRAAAYARHLGFHNPARGA
jgi:hypothetical protein